MIAVAFNQDTFLSWGTRYADVVDLNSWTIRIYFPGYFYPCVLLIMQQFEDFDWIYSCSCKAVKCVLAGTLKNRSNLYCTTVFICSLIQIFMKISDPLI